MPEYMLLLYGSESADEAERAQRWAEMPLWDQVNASLREAGCVGRARAASFGRERDDGARSG